VGDIIVCLADNSTTGDESAVGGQWAILQGNVILPELKFVFQWDWSKMGPPSGSSDVEAIFKVLINETPVTFSLKYNSGASPSPRLELVASDPIFSSVNISGSIGGNWKFHIEAFVHSTGSFGTSDLVIWDYKATQFDPNTLHIRTTQDGAVADYDWINRIDTGVKIMTLTIIP
jgi:hypothetical protein